MGAWASSRGPYHPNEKGELMFCNCKRPTCDRSPGARPKRQPAVSSRLNNPDSAPPRIKPRLDKCVACTMTQLHIVYCLTAMTFQLHLRSALLGLGILLIHLPAAQAEETAATTIRSARGQHAHRCSSARVTRPCLDSAHELCRYRRSDA